VKQPVKRAAIGAIVVLIVIGVAFLAFRQINDARTVSLNDYQTAQTATENVRKAYTELENAYYAFSVATPPAAAQLKATNTKLADYQSAVAKLSDLEALQSGDLQKKYQTFITHNKQYLSDISGYLKDRAALTTLLASDCYKKATTLLPVTPEMTTNFDAIAKDCQTVITPLKQSDSKGLQAYATSLNTYFTERRAHYEELKNSITGASNASLTSVMAKLVSQQTPDAAKVLATSHTNASVRQSMQDLANLTIKKVAETKATTKK
jgi:DnaJ-domain-containing protein 1